MSDVGWANAPWWLRWLMLALIYTSEYRYGILIATLLAALGWGAWVFSHP